MTIPGSPRSQKACGDIDIIADDDPGRHLLADEEFPGAGTQDGPHQCLETGGCPAGRQGIIDHAVEGLEVVHRATCNRRQQACIGRMAETTLVEDGALIARRGDHLVGGCCAAVDFIEDLDGGKSGRAAAGRRGLHPVTRRVAASSTILMQAMAASLPLFLRAGSARSRACS